MPIYEFRCSNCGHIQEMLIMSSSTEVEMKCEACEAEGLERVLSTVSYAMGSSKGEMTSPSATNRTCGPGNSCSTLTLPGHTR